MKKITVQIIVLLVALTINHPAFAERVNQWIFQGTIKPKSIRTVIVDPSTDITYVGTDTAGVWAKKTSFEWKSVGPETGAGALTNSVSSLSIGNGMLFAGTTMGVFYRNLSASSDVGWNRLGPAPEASGALIRPVSSLTGNGAILIAGTDQGVWRKDIGTELLTNDWLLLGPDSGPGSHLRESYDLFLRASDLMIYVGTKEGVLSKNLASTSGSWSRVGPEMGDGSLTGRIYSLAHNQSSSVLYAATNNGVFSKNISEGDTTGWSLVGLATGEGSLVGRVDVLYVNMDISTLYAGSSNGVFSKNIGHLGASPAWTRVGPSPGTEGALSGPVSGLYAQESILYAATPNGLFSKNMTGTSGWALVGGDQTLPDADIDSAVFYGNVLYVASPGLNGVWSKNLADVASRWSSLGAGPGDGSSTHRINTLFLRGSILYAGTSAEIGTPSGVFFRNLAPGSVPGWTRFGPAAGSSGSLDHPVYSFYVDGSTLYVGTFAGVFQRDLSAPSSAAWMRVGSPTDFSVRVNALSIYHSKLYAGTLGGVWSKSIRPAATDNWAPDRILSEGREMGEVNGLLVYGDHLYAATQDGLRLYTDSPDGARWSSVSSTTDVVNAMVLRQGANQSRLYLATRNQGVLESDNALMHFSPFNALLTNTTNVKTLFLSSESSRPIYAGLTGRGGVYRMQPSGCQNGIVEPREPPPHEECDDGNSTLLDGCSATCTSETISLSGPATGTVQAGRTLSLDLTLVRTGFTAATRIVRHSVSPSADITLVSDPQIVSSGTGSATIPVSLQVGSGVAAGTYDLVLRGRVEGGTLEADTGLIRVTVTPPQRTVEIEDTDRNSRTRGTDDTSDTTTRGGTAGTGGVGGPNAIELLGAPGGPHQGGAGTGGVAGSGGVAGDGTAGTGGVGGDGSGGGTVADSTSTTTEVPASPSGGGCGCRLQDERTGPMSPIATLLILSPLLSLMALRKRRIKVSILHARKFQEFRWE